MSVFQVHLFQCFGQCAGHYPAFVKPKGQDLAGIEFKLSQKSSCRLCAHSACHDPVKGSWNSSALNVAEHGRPHFELVAALPFQESMQKVGRIIRMRLPRFAYR